MAKLNVRLRAVELAFALGVVLVLGRAAHVQLLEGERYAAAAQGQRTEHMVLPAPRGDIFDRKGTTLAMTVERFHVGVAADQLADPAAALGIIAASLGESRREVRSRLGRAWATFYGPYTSTQVQNLRRLPGVYLTGDLDRFHPNPGFAQPLLGYPSASGRPASGIERVLDTLLTGIPGHAVVLKDVTGTRYSSPARHDAFPIPGHDVWLTIDAELQEIVETTLDDALREYSASSGDVVVLNPRNGEVLAITSRNRSGHGTTRAFTSIFEPGSTAKVFAAAALLSENLVDLSDSVWTENGTWVTKYRTIKDDHPSGWLTFEEVLAHSSNIGIAKLTRRLAPATQFTVLRAFGLGSPTGIEYPSEAPGILRLPHEWSRLTQASLSMGYELAVTTLQLAQAYAVVANDGVMMQPTLIREVRDARGRLVYQHRPEPVRTVLSPGVARRLRAALRAVVYPGGTGETAALETYEMAGKTGTARRASGGRYVPNSYTASFVSLFPADDPQLLMVVKLDDPRGTYARTSAAPLTRAVLQQVLAAETDALDRGPLSNRTMAPRAASAIPVRAKAFRTSWPPPSSTYVQDEATAVPDVSGLSLRAAARRLHAGGLAVRPLGWGTVIEIDPQPGSLVAPGTVIRVVARDSVEGR